jgi:hypothetical protein
MSTNQQIPKIPLPKGWNKHVRSAVLHVISLVPYATIDTRGWSARPRHVVLIASPAPQSVVVDRRPSAVVLVAGFLGLRQTPAADQARVVSQEAEPPIGRKPYGSCPGRTCIVEVEARDLTSVVDIPKANVVYNVPPLPLGASGAEVGGS